MTMTTKRWTMGHQHWVSDGLDWWVGWHKDSTPKDRALKCLSLLKEYDEDMAKKLMLEALTDVNKSYSQYLIDWFSHNGIYLGGN